MNWLIKNKKITSSLALFAIVFSLSTGMLAVPQKSLAALNPLGINKAEAMGTAAKTAIFVATVAGGAVYALTPAGWATGAVLAATAAGTAIGGIAGYAAPGAILSGSDKIIGSVWLFLTGTIYYILWSVFLIIAPLFEVLLEYGVSSDLLGAQMININMGWIVVRDIANMLFLFMMLYISIGTIFQIQGVNWKKALPEIILAAVLINFSLAIGKITVDSSNIIGNFFLNEIRKEAVAFSPENTDSSPGITTIIIKKMGLDRALAKETEAKDASTNFALGFSYLLASILFIFATLVLAAGGAMFLVRTVALTFILIFAPIGFIAPVLPKTFESYSGEWWSKLFGQSFFAPAYLFMLYITAKIATGPALLYTGKDTTYSSLVASMGLQADPSKIAASASGGIALVFNYLLILGCLYGAQQIASKMSGATGTLGKMAAGTALGAGLGAAGLAGRATIGRGAQAILQSDKFQKFTAGKLDTTGMSGVKKWSVEQANKLAQKTKVAEISKTALEATGKGSMDIRGTKLFGQIEKMTGGIDTGKAGAGILGGEGALGGVKGYAGAEEQQKKEDKAKREAVETAEMIQARQDVEAEVARFAAPVAAGAPPAVLNNDKIKKAMAKIKGDEILKLTAATRNNAGVMKHVSTAQRKTINEKGEDNGWDKKTEIRGLDDIILSNPDANRKTRKDLVPEIAERKVDFIATDKDVSTGKVNFDPNTGTFSSSGARDKISKIINQAERYLKDIDPKILKNDEIITQYSPENVAGLLNSDLSEKDLSYIRNELLAIHSHTPTAADSAKIIDMLGKGRWKDYI